MNAAMISRRRAALGMLAATVLVLASACGGDDGDEGTPATIDGTSWVVVPDSVGVDVPDGVEVTIDFADGQVSGSSGCNRFTGTYTIDGDTLTFGPLASTKMACEGPVQSVEDQVLVALSSVDGYDVGADTLDLLSGSDIVLQYTAA